MVLLKCKSDHVIPLFKTLPKLPTSYHNPKSLIWPTKPYIISSLIPLWFHLLLFLITQLQLNWPPCYSPNSSIMLSPPGFYTCCSLCLEPSSPRCTHSLLTPFRSLFSNITLSEKPSLSTLYKTAYTLSPFSVSLPCVVFLFSIYQLYYLFIICLRIPFSRI